MRITMRQRNFNVIEEKSKQIMFIYQCRDSLGLAYQHIIAKETRIYLGAKQSPELY